MLISCNLSYVILVAKQWWGYNIQVHKLCLLAKEVKKIVIIIIITAVNVFFSCLRGWQVYSLYYDSLN